MRSQLIAALILIASTANSFAAIAFDAASSVEQNGMYSTISVNHTVSGNDRILIAFPSAENSTTGNMVVTAMTYNSVAMTKLTTSSLGSQRIELWYLLNPDVGTYSVSATYTGSSNDSRLGVISLTGVKQSAPTVYGQTSVNGTSISLSLTTPSANCWIVDSAVNGSSVSTISEGASQTNRYQLEGTAYTQDGSTKVIASAGSASTSWSSSTSADWVQVSVAVEEVASAAPSNGLYISNGIWSNTVFQ
jgi:hypothetical protein